MRRARCLQARSKPLCIIIITFVFWGGGERESPDRDSPWDRLARFTCFGIARNVQCTFDTSTSRRTWRIRRIKNIRPPTDWVGSIELESPDSWRRGERGGGKDGQEDAGIRGWAKVAWGRVAAAAAASIVRNYMEKIPVRRRAFSLLS